MNTILGQGGSSLLKMPSLSMSDLNQGTGGAYLDVFNSPVGRASLAMTTPEYPVTPGDIYTLTFITANGVVTSPILVDANFGVNLANVGHVDARNLSFAGLKKTVEEKVLNAYPLSAPQLIVQSCGVFPVYVQGETATATTEYCWGMSRLSSLWNDATPSASSRAVILKRGGTSQSYDLFKVWRFGDLGQDPYLKPGDTVVFTRAALQVTLAGAVRRPGAYQPLQGEGVAELVRIYGDGLLPTAKPELSTLVRRSSPALNLGGVVRFNLNGDPGQVPQLVDGDTFTIASTESYLPVVYLEGAFKSEENPEAAPANGTLSPSMSTGADGGQQQYTPPTGEAGGNYPVSSAGNSAPSGLIMAPSTAQILAGANPGSTTVVNEVSQNGTGSSAPPQSYVKKRLPYREGELLSHALQDISDQLSSKADLPRAFIVRKGQVESIPIDLERLLYAYDPKADIVLQPEDRIIIPYGSADIFVTGEVIRSAWVNSAALRRLRDIIDPLLTKYSSIRDVTVKNENGDSKSYDLFRAEREGDISQNPFVKAGDIISVFPFQRSVTLGGEVKRPGNYQLLAGEGLKDLIEF